MKRLYLLFVFLGFLLAPLWSPPVFVHADSLQPQGGVKTGGGLVEVRADPNYRPSRILPPQSLLETQAATAVFTINYLVPGSYHGDSCTSWPTAAKTAFTYAANL